LAVWPLAPCWLVSHRWGSVGVDRPSNHASPRLCCLRRWSLSPATSHPSASPFRRLRGCRAYLASDLSPDDGSAPCGEVRGRWMSLIITSNTSSASASAAAVTLLAISRTSLPQKLLCHLPSNLFQHPRATFGTHITTFHTRISSPLFFRHLFVLPSLNSITNCLCGCNARLPPRTYSISHPFGVFVLPFRAPTSWIPLHRFARRLDRLGNHRRRLLPYSGTSEVIPISRAYYT
jgi:hypothetical protein